MGKDTYRNPKNKISLLYCLKNLLGAVKEPAVFHKLLWIKLQTYKIKVLNI